MDYDSLKQPVLVTGARGFLGRHVVAKFLALGIPVVAVVSQPSELSTQWEREYPDTYRTFVANLRSSDFQLPPTENFRAVVHLASYVPSSAKRDAMEELHLSRNGILEPLERLLSAIRGRTSILVLASSSTVYGSRSGVFRETDMCDASSFYGVFKLASEGISRCFAETNQMKLACLRVTQLYGPGEPHGTALQRVFVAQARSGGEINLIRGGRDEKDLLWVEDAAAAVVRVVEQQATGVFNIASGIGSSIAEIARVLRVISSGKLRVNVGDDGAPAISQILDITRARQTLGFEPAVSLQKGLEMLCAL
jgi:UDP-glucose 4-epimerase